MTCPECNGKCCRNIDTKYRTQHMGAEVYEHMCEACHDGTMPQPDPRDAEIAKLQGEVALWRARAEVCGSTLSMVVFLTELTELTEKPLRDDIKEIKDLCANVLKADAKEIELRAQGLAMLAEFYSYEED